MYKNSVSFEQAKERILPLLKACPRCALCAKEFERITASHLRIHREYLEANKGVKWRKPKLPEGELTGVEATEAQAISQFVQRPETLVETYERLFSGVNRLNACISKLFSLYHPSKAKWLLMDKPIMPRYATWHQVTPESKGFIPNRLCTQVIKDHLLFNCTVGVFAKNRYETWFVSWDVDAKTVYSNNLWDPFTGAQQSVASIVKLLRKWGFQPHVVLSGGKVYHVTLYFRQGIPLSVAMQLYKAVLTHPAGPTESDGLKIECLRFSVEPSSPWVFIGHQKFLIIS